MKALLALLLAPLVLIAAGSATPSSAAETLEVNVGVVQSLTGAGGVYGKTVIQGIDLAVSQINAVGGDNRIYISTTTMDDKSTVDGGKLAYSSFADQKVSAIIGPTLSGVANGTLKIAQDNRIVNLAPTTTALGITDAGDYVFNVALTEDTVVPATIKAVAAKTSVKRSVLFLDSSDAFSRGSADAMRKGIAASGGSIVREIDVASDPDVSAGIAALSNVQFDSALVTPLADKAVVILKALRGAGYKQTVIGGNSFNTLEIWRQAGDAAEGAYVGAAWNVATVSPQNTRFVDAFTQAYGVAPDQYAAQGYASVQILAAAVRRANSDSPDAIKAALTGLKGISTPLGDVSFAANRYATYAPVVQQIEDGQLTVLAGSDSSSSAKPDPSVQSKRIMLIHSYDDQFHWTSEQGKGIVAGLSDAGMKQGRDYDLMTYFMDTRVKYTSTDQIKARAAEALQLIEDYKPDLVFITDDVALQYVAVPHAMGKSRPDLPFIFSGINGEPTDFSPIKSLAAPGGPISGALERIPFAFAFKSTQQVFPGVTSMALLADSSASSAAVVANFRSAYKPGDSSVQITGFEQIDTYAAWKQRIAELQTQVGAIGVLNYHRLKDEAGNVVPGSEVAAWTVANSKIPVVALVTDWAQDGIVMAAGNSGLKTGAFVAKMGVDVLKGLPPGQIAIVDPHLTEIAFNLHSAGIAGMTIPAASLADAAEVYR